MIRAQDIMTPNPITVGIDKSVMDIAKMMAEMRIGSVIVTDVNNRPIGIVTSHDILEKVVAKGLDPRKVPAGQIMSSPVIYVDPETPLEEVVRLMVKTGKRHIPVVSNNKILGIIAEYDIISLGPELVQSLDLISDLLGRRSRSGEK